MAEEKTEVLASGMVRVLDALRFDRPSAWSKSFEGLSPFDLHILAIVQAKPDVILREIKEYLDVPNSTLTGIIDRLENRGLIERVISSRDRRSFGLKLTGKGRALRAEQLQVRRSAAAKMLGALDSEKEKETFVAMMVKIGDRLQTEEGK
jgi:DNA-binding MarR family transcriptional regulator